MLSLFLSTDCSLLRVGESKKSEELDPTTQIPEMIIGHKPTSEVVTARSKSHADSHQIRFFILNILVKGKKSLTTWKVRN